MSGPAPGGPGRLATALLVAVSFGVSLAAAEGVLRVARPMTMGFSFLTRDGLRVHLPGREGVYRRAEFAARVRFNARGFRGGPFRVPKPPESFRILALGDSFTEGLQVDEAALFTSRIERGLASTMPGVEVLNLGVSGYGTDDALAVLRRYGPELEPDLVLLFYCLANDTRNNLLEGRCALDARGALACRRPTPPGALRFAVSSLKSFAGAHLHLYQALRAAATSPWFYRLGLRAAPAEEGRPGMPFGLDLYLERPPGYLAEALDLTRALVDALRAEAARHGAPLWLVLIPLREQVEDALWAELRAGSDAPLVREGPQRGLRRIGAELGVPTLDLWPAFRARELRGDHLYWRHDGHFNEIGHEVAADVVVAQLRAAAIAAE